jgi:hypothetical protein
MPNPFVPQGQAPAQCAKSAAQATSALAVATAPLAAAAGRVGTAALGITGRCVEALGQPMSPRLARAKRAPRVLPAVLVPTVGAYRQAPASRLAETAAGAGLSGV